LRQFGSLDLRFEIVLPDLHFALQGQNDFAVLIAARCLDMDNATVWVRDEGWTPTIVVSTSMVSPT
jgi:hypothetical protein